jgi:hypothetical protein
MKRQIRKNVFESNSSSTHAICISKDMVDKTKLPKHVTFTHDEFGWEFNVHSDTWTKASYLYEAIFDCYEEDERQEKLDQVSELLSKYNIDCEFEPTKDLKWGDGYIDHGYDTIDFVNAVLNDGEKLITYLFGDSFVVTGNDNGYSYSDYMYVNKGEETTNWGTYTNYGDLKPEFDNYEIFEKWN